MWRQLCFFVVLLSVGGLAAQAAPAMALVKRRAMRQAFSHFDYVNPNAPWAGRLLLPGHGSFDSLNPFTLKGDKESAWGSWWTRWMETRRALCHVWPAGRRHGPGRRWPVGRFHLNPAARLAMARRCWPKTSRPVLTPHPRQNRPPALPHVFCRRETGHRADTRTVRFDFHRRNAELHMILGELPVFARRWLQQ